jgi:hypothetical protein
MPDQQTRAPLSDLLREAAPAPPTQQERGYGTELLKRLMWENLGVDYSKDRYGLYNDTPTRQEETRQKAAGKPTIGDLQQRSIEMEQKLQRPPAPPWQPRQEQIHLVPFEGNDPFQPSATLESVDHDPFQSDPYTAAQPPAEFRDPLGPALTAFGQRSLQNFMTPGIVAQGVTPEQPGMVSDADIARQLMLDEQARKFGVSYMRRR